MGVNIIWNTLRCHEITAGLSPCSRSEALKKSSSSPAPSGASTEHRPYFIDPLKKAVGEWSSFSHLKPDQWA